MDASQKDAEEATMKQNFESTVAAAMADNANPSTFYANLREVLLENSTIPEAKLDLLNMKVSDFMGSQFTNLPNIGDAGIDFINNNSK
jgi:hypothetical protein